MTPDAATSRVLVDSTNHLSTAKNGTVSNTYALLYQEQA